MNRALLTLLGLALCSSPALAVICKTVDADGVVSYSDVPASECPEVVKLPEYSSYTPRPLPSTEPAAASMDTAQDSEEFSGYSDISIVIPEANGTVRSNEGIVQVALSLNPPLQPGHRIKLFLDGGAVAGEFDGPAIELTGVERGTHSLRAVVSDAAGRRLGDSSSVRFTLRKTTIYDRDRQRPPGIPENPIEPAPENPIAPGPENPVAPAEPPTNLQPNPGQFGTPGTTNPAFAPKFTP
jgi:hypothetical protein